MKIGIVSTFSDSGYKEYAKNFVNSLNKFLDPKISVYLYVDNKKLFKRNENIHCLLLEKTVPDLTAFKIRNKDKTYKNFITDAVRFSHKSYAIWHAALHSEVDMLIWLDADSELIQPVSEKYLQKFLPPGCFTSYLGRDSYSETGFIAFDLKNLYCHEFFQIYKNYYDSDSIYTLSAFTDCHVFDSTRIQLENAGKIKSHNLTPHLGKQHFNKTFQGFIIHLKGDNKAQRDRIFTKRGIK